MREESNKVIRYDCYVASDMLRQAADALERKKREIDSCELQIERWFHQALKDSAEAKALRTENAKLREIVFDMACKLHHDYCCDNRNALDGCDIKDCHNAGICALVARAKKEVK